MKIEDESFYVAEFNANELKTLRQFIDQFWEAFCIPNEKQYSLDALSDYMRDLFWIEPKQFKIIVNNYHNYIQKGYNLNFVEEILRFYQKYWNEIGCKFIIVLK